MTELILASTSKYRAELLNRLGVEFLARAPQVDERIAAGEGAGEAAARLALAKAEAIDDGAVVIGADQVPSLDGEILRKPGSHAAALAQLTRCSNRTVLFHTAVAVLDRRDGRVRQTLDVTEVEFAELGTERLERYLERERPYDCAGGFKAEGLGIALFRAVRSSDPTALIGLPLIWLSAALRDVGFDPLDGSARKGGGSGGKGTGLG